MHNAPFPPRNKLEIFGSIFGDEASSILLGAILSHGIEQESLMLLHRIDILKVVTQCAGILFIRRQDPG
jgi:hypothetical protein